MFYRALFIFLVVFISEARSQKYPYTLQADIGLLAGEKVSPVPAVQVFNGVRVDKFFSEAGITVGADIYKQLTILPLQIGVKWMPFQDKNLKPFLSFSAGYGIPLLNNKPEGKGYKGGAVINPSIGLRIKSKSKARLNFMAGFKHQRASILTTTFDALGKINSVLNEEYRYSRISLGFGVGF
ncbi:hypothetical protein [Daejeonella lutea]|uniref:Outer membrane protein beta-barrel domain-containing protein n=1 Tax=Daejeonella lutea TaxID=572036 RepID=A0A1T5DT29_9SPHI|nr:hypothetical protein [Daejeonella lutea]SKB74982.1 hypothetical protein SAMN05661099_2596 [Daejeonella lutea]